ncbi:anoctamin-7 [Puma concolor]|uniref:Anoctamin n=1 Tax=Puma concolor TaxID=9696 RepID=A0A6P6IEH0_PUMCO|nr:anoctamin-7 [Puma concolor]
MSSPARQRRQPASVATPGKWQNGLYHLGPPCPTRAPCQAETTARICGHPRRMPPLPNVPQGPTADTGPGIPEYKGEHRSLPVLCLWDWPGLSCPDQACAEKLAMTSEASSGSRRPRSGMLRRQSPEEDSTVLIDVAPEAEKGHTYGSTAPTSEPIGPLDRDPTLQRAIQGENGAVQYVLLRAPWAVLCYYAEDLRLKLPLQELPNQASNWSAGLLAWLGLPNILLEDVPDVPPEYYSCPFKVSKLSRFLGSDNQENFFTSTERHQILFAILAKTPYGHEKKGLCGIDQLLAEGVFSAAFPLHDGPFRTPPEGPQAPGLTQRQVLFRYWARWSQWNKYQPLDHVRRYFGEKVAFYFAWLGFYTGWLLPAAAVGTLVFLVGCFLVFSDIPTQELCSSTDHFEMCPLCLDCPFWLLSSACTLVQASRLFDHGGTVFFSVFMALWAVLLLEYWKRQSATLAYRWGCSDYEDIEERPRPQFAASAPTTAPNPVTGEDEPYFPERSRVRRVLAGSAVVVMMVAVVVVCLVSIILYRAITATLVSRSNNTLLAAWASRVASFTGSVVNLVFILVLSKIYVALAHILTRWEMHRTQTKFEDAFTLKVFIFQFVNFYSSPIYIAFFKGRFVGYPGNYHTLFGVRNEECAAGGCLIELAQELLVIMVGKQIINNVQEILVPCAAHSSWARAFLSIPSLEASTRGSSERPQASGALTRDDWGSISPVRDASQDVGPDADVLRALGHRAPVLADELARVQADLHPVVEQREERRERTRGHEDGDEAELQHCGRGPPARTSPVPAEAVAVAANMAPTHFERSRNFCRQPCSFLEEETSRKTALVLPGLATLALWFRVSCRYQAFREDDGQYSPTYWNLLAIRLAFVIVFEHVVFSIGRILDLLVPDIPESVEVKVKREYYLAKQALAENEMGTLEAAVADGKLAGAAEELTFNSPLGGRARCGRAKARGPTPTVTQHTPEKERTLPHQHRVLRSRPSDHLSLPQDHDACLRQLPGAHTQHPGVRQRTAWLSPSTGFPPPGLQQTRHHQKHLRREAERQGGTTLSTRAATLALR